MLAEIEVVDVHVVVMQRPAGRLGFREIGIAVGRVQPGAAYVERNAEMLRRGEGAAADPVHRFENLEGQTGGAESLGGGQAGGTGTDHNGVNVFHGLSAPLAS